MPTTKVCCIVPIQPNALIFIFLLLALGCAAIASYIFWLHQPVWQSAYWQLILCGLAVLHWVLMAGLVHWQYRYWQGQIQFDPMRRYRFAPVLGNRLQCAHFGHYKLIDRRSLGVVVRFQPMHVSRWRNLLWPQQCWILPGSVADADYRALKRLVHTSANLPAEASPE